MSGSNGYVDRPPAANTRLRARVWQDFWGPFDCPQTVLGSDLEFLTSLLPDGSHAPVLEARRRVTGEPAPYGTRLTFTGRLRRERLVRHICDLVEHGLLHPESLDLLERARPVGWWQRVTGRVGSVAIAVPFRWSCSTTRVGARACWCSRLCPWWRWSACGRA